LQASRVVVAAVAAGAALALAGPASPEPTWSAPVQPAPGEATAFALSPQVAMNGAGDALIGWEWQAGQASLTKVASRGRGATAWTAPVTLAEGGSEPSLAIDAAGDAVAGFQKGHGLSFSSSVFQASFRPGPGGAWQGAFTISPVPETLWGTVAANDPGDAVAAFTRWSENGYVIQAAVRPAASGRWEQVVDLSDPAGNSPRGAGIAIDRAGNAVALWVRAGPGADSPVVVSSFRPPGGAWSAPVAVGGPYADVWDMSVAFDAAGNAVAVWRAVGSGVFSSYRPFGGAWTPPTSLSAPNLRYTDDLDLTVDSAGNALTVWTQATETGHGAAMADSRPAAAGTWERPVRLSSPEALAFAATLASDRAGNAVAVWSEGSSLGAESVHAALRPAASGAWEHPIQIGTDVRGYDLAAAMDDHGNAVAAWEREVGAGHVVIDSSDLVAGGPVLAQLRVPDRGAAGVRTTFHVTPAPWASPLAGEPVWEFGDGASARGASVPHTYRRTGTYTVAVAASDAAGRNSRSTARIVVARATLANRQRPVIAGVPHVGATLTCLPGKWSGSEPILFRYAWLRGGGRAASSARYRVRPGDAGSLLSCRVTATNGPLTRAATSRPVRIRR
jgi:hypothetical protein